MIILAIDTATPHLSAAIGGPDGVLGLFSIDAGRRHAETLAPGLDFLTKATGTPLADIDVVAVDIGPGLFTGLRVGLATAKALADALDRPTVGVTSLDLLAQPHCHESRLVAAVVDARRHEVFWTLYRPKPGGCVALNAPTVCTPDVLARELADLGEDVLVVGDGGVRYAAELRAQAKHIEVGARSTAFPSAATLLDLAADAADAGRCATGADLHPLYLRAADVRIGWDQRPAEAAATQGQPRA